MNLRRTLRLLALLAALLPAGFWLAKGAHRGWSQNRVPVAKTDEITGISYTTYEDRFVPGVEILSAGVAAAVLLGAASFFVRAQPSLKSNP